MASFDSILRRGPTFDEVLPSLPVQEYAPDPNTTYFGRGVASALQGVTGGSYAARALDAERAGNLQQAAVFRAAADEQAKRAALTAPLNDYRNIRGVGDVSEFVQGALGSGIATMAPPLAGALAGRFLSPLRALAPAASFTGAAIPGYLMERNEAIQNQYQDPVQAAVDPERRLDIARVKGAAAGALEAIVPSALTRFAPAGRGVVRNIVGNMAQEGATEAAQTVVGQQAQGYLNPNRDTADDIPEIINAGLQGAISGGGLATPHAVVSKGVDLLQQGADAAYNEAKNLKLGDMAPGIVVPGDFEATMKNIEASESTRAEKAKMYAQQLLDDDSTPEDIRKKIIDLNGDFSNPEAQSMVGNAVLFNRAGRRAAGAVMDLKENVEDWMKKAKKAVEESGAEEALGKAKRVAGAVVNNARDGAIRKLNAQDPLLESDIEGVVSKHLSEDVADQPAVQAHVKELSKLVRQLVTRGAETDDAALRAFGGFKSMRELFTDPEAMLDDVAKTMGMDKALSDRFTKINTANEELKGKNPRFLQAVPTNMREQVTPEVQRAMADFIDDVTSGRVKSKINPVEVLNKIYKDEGVTRAVLDYYQRRSDPEGKYEQHANLTEQDESSRFLFANDEAQRPWHKTDLVKGVEAAKGQRGLRSSRMLTMRDYVQRNEGDPRQAIGQVYRDIQSRIAEEQKRVETEPSRQANIDRLTQQAKEISDVYAKVMNDPDLQDMSEADRKTFAANNALNNFVVGEIHGPANEQANDMQADDNFVRDSKRGLKAKTRDPAEQVVFETKDGKDLVLHAPSMVNAMSKRQGSGRGEGGLQRASRLLKDAISSVLSRPEVTGIKTKTENISLFGSTVDEIDAGEYGHGKRHELIKQLQKTKEPGKREKLIERIKEMAVEAPADVNNAKPRTELETDLMEYNGTTEDKFTQLADYARLGQEQLAETRESVDDALLDIRERNAPLQRKMAEAIKAMRAEEHTKAEWATHNQAMQEARRNLKYRREEAARYYELLQTLDEIQDEMDGGVTGLEDFEEEGVSRSAKEDAGKPRFDESEKEGGAPKLLGTSKAAERPKQGRSMDVKQVPINPNLTKEAVKLLFAARKAGKNARFRNMQDVHQDPNQWMTEDEAKQIRSELERMRGKDVQVILDKFAHEIGGSGDYLYKNGKRIIRVAKNALDPLGVAYHEAMHDFLETLGKDPKARAFKQALKEAAENPIILNQLKKLLQGHPEAIKQVESDPTERLSYAFQFWATGMLRVGPQTQNWFMKMLNFIGEMLGVISKQEKLRQVFLALHEGDMADLSTVGAVITDKKIQTIQEKAREISGPVGDYAEKLFSGATDRLRNSGIDAFTEIANMFHRDPNNEKGELGFLQKRSQTTGKFMNKLEKAIGGASHTEVAEALSELQLMKQPTTEVGKRVKALLQELHDYMTEAGVMRRRPDGSWAPLGFVKNYFPRVWDKAVIRQNEQEFKELMEKYTTKKTAEDIFKAITGGDGSVDLAENEHHIGFTPFSQAVNKRKLDFINEKTVPEFQKFMSKDMIETLSTYIFQATHRGEYARYFGNAGEKISELLQQAAEEGATSEELVDAGKVVRAMEGTLGHDMNPRLRDLMAGLIAYENIVLLPFAIFASLIDPLGVAIRSNDIKEGWHAAVRGVKQIAQTMMGTYKQDAQYEMARTLGLIDENNMMEQMGQVYAGQYMSKSLKKMNDKFFRWNGMESWNQGMRIAAMSAAQRFMVRNKNNARYMNELGLQASDIKEMPNGGIALTQSDGLTAEQEKRVHDAIFRWVDGAVLRPNAAHRPVWGSDPHWMLVFHLKQFTYTFQNTILKRVREEFLHGNTKPAWILASYVPFMMFSDLLKAALTGNVKTNWDVVDYVAHGLSRSGALGISTFGADALADIKLGKPPIASFMGPTAGHALTILESLGPSKDFGDVLMRSVPAAPLVKSVTS